MPIMEMEMRVDSRADPFLSRLSSMLRKLPLAANPNSAILITINERGFHCPIENTRVSRTSKARVLRETRKMAGSSIGLGAGS